MPYTFGNKISSFTLCDVNIKLLLESNEWEIKILPLFEMSWHGKGKGYIRPYIEIRQIWDITRA